MTPLQADGNDAGLVSGTLEMGSHTTGLSEGRSGRRSAVGKISLGTLESSFDSKLFVDFVDGFRSGPGGSTDLLHELGETLWALTHSTVWSLSLSPVLADLGETPSVPAVLDFGDGAPVAVFRSHGDDDDVDGIRDGVSTLEPQDANVPDA